WNHPQRERWVPGGGGMCLHTILLDPRSLDRIRIAVSTAGMYVTEDGGETWRPSNKGVRADFLPDKYPEFGQCVHKVVQSKVNPDRMFLQNHWGLYRSDDSGEKWKDVAKGVPSDFGFAMAIHPEDPDCAWIVPLESDGFRCTPEGKLRVYRTENAGKSWEAMTKGLPQRDAYETILRDALANDPLDPAGVYFGTRNGKLFGSSDEGKKWSQLADGLPAVVSVKAVSISLPRKR
ncbi:MAG TPA: exo-alpha-sialidase, partial [Thermoanaerobaculia bacterium]|nr:exo-alpha-sialidase [Thermoanaerobaculia bacterium]